MSKVLVRFFLSLEEKCFYQRQFNSPAEALIPKKGEHLMIDMDDYVVKDVHYGAYDEYDDGDIGDMIDITVEYTEDD